MHVQNLGTLANWLHPVSILGGCGCKHIPCSGCCNHRFYTCKLLASCMHAGARGGGCIGSQTAPKRKWVVENLLWMGEMKQDREGYLMKIMRYLVKLDNISDMLMKFFHFELPCV